MPDQRKHRGRAPGDDVLFGTDAQPVLRAAVADLSWLLARGYSQRAAVKLVGDHHELRERQRLAILRCACADADAQARRARQVPLSMLAGRSVAVDGFNCVITIESALGGGVLLRGRDGVLRDLASVRGSYRRVAETEAAVRALGATLAAAAPTDVNVLLDRPVSNSGRLAELMRTMADAAGWPWRVELVSNPDRELVARGAAAVVATGDAVVLDRCAAWVALPEAALAQTGGAAAPWIVEL